MRLTLYGDGTIAQNTYNPFTADSMSYLTEQSGIVKHFEAESDGDASPSFYQRRVDFVHRWNQLGIMDWRYVEESTRAHEHCWWLKTTTIAFDSTAQISYPTQLEHVISNKRRTRASFTKFLRRLISFDLLILTDDEIQEYAKAWGYSAKGNGYHFKIVKGKAVFEAYNTGPGSCMQGAECVKLYANNPDVVQLLQILDKSGNYYGRALIWQTDQGTLLDRVYPADGGPQMLAAHAYAAEKEWIIRLGTGLVPAGFLLPNGTQKEHADYRVALNYNDEGVPYMDTFKFLRSHKHGELKLSSSSSVSHIAKLERTDGEFPLCSSCGDYGGELHTVANGDILCESCLDEDYVCVGNAWYPRDECSFCHECDTAILLDDSVYLERYERTVCVRCLRRHYATCDECSESVEFDDATHLDRYGVWACEDCLEEHYVEINDEWVQKRDAKECEECEEWVVIIDLNKEGLCNDCQTKEETEAAND